MYYQTTATKKILSLKKRIRGVAGGTSASKTISILLWLIDYAQSNERQTISVVSETFPHLKRGAIRDFMNIMQEHQYFSDGRWNQTDCIYTFETGSIIEFFSADQPGKVRGPRRDVLFLNEANNIPYETYLQLEVRTRRIVWLDWNPVAEFWWYTEMVGKQDVDFLTLTYKDNEALPKEVVQALEIHKNNAGWWRVYGEGLLGESEGRIYRAWEMIDDIPKEARLERYGLDFGYSNDPTASDGIYKWNGAIVLDEVIHQTQLSNREIIAVYQNIPRALIVADSAEPKSIDEIKSAGLNIIASDKGQGSVLAGIQYVQDQKIFVTKRSVNTWREYRNYLWMTDKTGKIINEPSPVWNHHMDDIRYGITSLRGRSSWKPNNPGGIKPFFQGMPG